MVNFELSRSSRLYLRSIRCLRGRETETRVLPECTSSASRTDLGGPTRREGTRDGIRDGSQRRIDDTRDGIRDGIQRRIDDTRDGIRDGIQSRIRMEEGRRDVKVETIRLEGVGYLMRGSIKRHQGRSGETVGGRRIPEYAQSGASPPPMRSPPPAAHRVTATPCACRPPTGRPRPRARPPQSSSPDERGNQL